VRGAKVGGVRSEVYQDRRYAHCIRGILNGGLEPCVTRSNYESVRGHGAQSTKKRS
jgi:hypothetical protein